ncbi:tRNA dimethylallyltransferase, variant [Aphanomyces invadans]|nr:tRNA dimethylallyltransferase, variant [Aphanomyces invadans]ETW01847.1 tRNA dimethylallyltransferase, variant [Aphanomyces invadans]|eukprot:XP_008869695.1 tRNA dimethylallyltransferase, variant [Aphanomyces invadans]
MYYTQSILWKAQLIEEAAGVNGNDNAAIPADADAAYQALVQIDPEMAQRLHSRDVRRVQRSLEVFYQTGVKHSELIAKQAHENDEMLFDACMLWVDCDRSVLAQRLDDRVDTMVQAGLVLEIEALMDNIQHHLAASPIPLGQKGISQAIGFKEFRPYLEARAAGHDTATVLEQCIEQLKIGTRQYAKRQLTWIRNRIVPRNIPVYKLDTTDVAQWPTNVTAPAMAIVSAFLKNESIDVPACVASVDVDSADKKVKNLCEPCGNREFVGLAQWNEHLRSKGHRYHMKRLRLLETGQLFDRPPPKKPKDKTEGMEPKEMGGASATRSP